MCSSDLERVVQASVFLRIANVDAAREYGDGAGGERASVGGRIDAPREARGDHELCGAEFSCELAREAGANHVYLASCAPPIRYPNVYGIDMPTREEFIATGRTEEQIAREIGADAVVYQDLDALIASICEVNPALTRFDTSCFSGEYITGDVTGEYLALVEKNRDAGRQQGEDDHEANQLDLNAA